MGLALAFCLMAVMVRLGVARWLAFVLAALFTASPITAVYENWVFYEYPVMVALIVAAWAMERYIRTPRFADALLFFASLAVLASVRGVYHLSWFAFLAALLIWITSRHWKIGLRAAAVPALLIIGFYVKNYVMFGDLIPGQMYKKINYADMVQQQAPQEALDRLQRQGRIGAIFDVPVLETRTEEYAELVKQPMPTGIALLDRTRKSTGADNWNSAWRARVADVYYRDAQVVAGECPGYRGGQLRANVVKYLLPASDVFPFDHASNATRLQPFLHWYERTTAGEVFADPDSDDPIAWLNVFLLPACLLGGLVYAIRTWPKRGTWNAESGARCATVLFLLFNVAWVSSVTIVFSSGDHNRYREEVAPLYVVLLGLLVNSVWTRSARYLSSRRAVT
jgi:hypothetical protein